MKLFLQFGHGMKSLTLRLAEKWGGAETSVILSPRDMSPGQLRRWSREFARAGVQRYFDPQCYSPGGRLKNLSEYPFWNARPDAGSGRRGPGIARQLEKIKECNDIAGTKAYILPCTLRDYDDDSWADRFVSDARETIDAGKKCMGDKPVYATLALPKGFLLQNENVIEPVLMEILTWETDGFYVIAEALDRQYLIDDPMWLSNVLHICAALKIAGKKIIFGYGNHQLLLLALLRVDALASGTWLNVRSFTNRFIGREGAKRKTTWIYYPEALSEYKLAFLDWAFNNGYLDSMKSKDKDFLNEGIQKLFHPGVQPSDTDFNETDAFRHYLCCLKHQIELLDRAGGYEEAFESYELLLTTAEREIERLEKAGIYAQSRSFRDVVDVNRAALTRLNAEHGFSLKMSWGSL